MSENTLVQNYEVMLLFSSALSESDVKKEIEMIKEHILAAKGEVTFEDFWGKRPLAYAVQKETTGFYHVMLFRAPKSFIPAFEKELRIQKKLLRFLITSTPKGYQPVTAGEVEASEEQYFAELHTKKTSGKKVRRPIEFSKAEAPVAPEAEKPAAGTAEERARKLDEILRSDLKI